jgi:hypothetical protein
LYDLLYDPLANDVRCDRSHSLREGFLFTHPHEST